MIIKDPNLDIPHGNSTIWRYMSLDKFLDLVMKRALFFTNASLMTDQYEGILPASNQKHRYEQLVKEGITGEEATLKVLSEATKIHRFRELTLLNCWTINPYESYALWKIYLGGAKSGVAIKTNVAKLVRALKNSKDPHKENIYYGKVRYANFILKEPIQRFDVITNKSTFYEYENELRLFILHEEPDQENRLPYDLYVGRQVGVDLDELIDEIYISPFSGKWFHESFAMTMKKVYPKLKNKIRYSEILDQ